MGYRSVFLSFLLVGFFVGGGTAHAIDLDTWGTSTIADFSIDYAMQDNPAPGTIRGQHVVPSSNIDFENITIYPCYIVDDDTVRTRLNIYEVNTSDYDDTTLIAYSDWETLTGSSTQCSYKELYEPRTYSFGWITTLQSGREYIITLSREGAPVQNVELRFLINFKANYNAVRYPYYSIYFRDSDYNPYEIDTFYSTSSYNALLMGSSPDPVAGDTYIEIVDVDGYYDSDLYTFSCSHTSFSSSQYDGCYSSTTLDAIVFNNLFLIGGDYDDYYVESWLLNADRRLLLDSEYYHRILYPSSESDIFTDIFSLPSDQQSETLYVYRTCLIPLYYESTSTIACATMVFGNGFTQSGWEDTYWTWTQDNDGVYSTVLSNGVCDQDEWIKTPINCAYQYASTTLIYFFPFGTAFGIWNIWLVTEATSTATSTIFDISLDASAFGLPTTTAHLPISSMAYQARNMAPGLFDAIDKILWGLFALFVALRIFSGTWKHGLESGEVTTKDYLNRNDRKHRLET